MIFHTEHNAPILAGRKTTTRRFWPDGRPQVKVGGEYWAQNHRWKAESRFARIRVIGLDWIPLDPISVEEAHAEGYDSVEAFKEAFMRIYKLTWWPANEMVWQVTFEVVVEHG